MSVPMTKRQLLNLSRLLGHFQVAYGDGESEPIFHQVQDLIEEALSE